ncbi:Hypothetical protein FKW44_004353 [Caligus rogercresseyi]|uniref:Uncharacterized protein n=1 Tax=Caligus rogercresseyi TaxID=217165 RepID=A0A7T8KB08_CALRO|nr:Hypothetical protein FKW44_004353 [Caligus rogercresseyi]
MDLKVDDPISQDVFSSPVATGSVEEVGVSQADTVVLSQSQDTQGSQDQDLRQHNMDEMEASQEDASEKIQYDFQAWNRRPIKASMEVTRDMFPQNHREAWMELFIKYNTPLPSSAIPPT